jgi:polysaccharide biosynthesis/export protein
MLRKVALLGASVLLSACASSSKSAGFVWVADYAQPTEGPQSYLIRPGDLIEVRVFNQQQMSGRARVRSDGRVTLPFLNDVEAAGYSPSVLAQQLQTRLKDFINAPVVTVSVEESKAATFSVLGNVLRPGQFPAEGAVTVLQALAQAGGLGEFAHRDRIFVLRELPQRARVRFRYQDLVQGQAKAATFTLRVGDVVVVE